MVFFIINHPFLVPPFMETPIYIYSSLGTKMNWIVLRLAQPLLEGPNNSQRKNPGMSSILTASRPVGGFKHVVLSVLVQLWTPWSQLVCGFGGGLKPRWETEAIGLQPAGSAPLLSALFSLHCSLADGSSRWVWKPCRVSVCGIY